MSSTEHALTGTFVFPASSGQERLWFLRELDASGGAAYHLHAAFEADGRLDRVVLQRALNHVVARHESLRTRIVHHEGRLVQAVVPGAQVTVSVVAVEDRDGDGGRAEAHRISARESRRPFSLEHGPLLRMTLLELPDGHHILLATLHHIVADAWSVSLLLAELAESYRAISAGEEPKLPELGLQYADFTVWQREWEQSEEFRGRLDHWRERLDGAPTLLHLPTDHPRPAVQTFQGDTVRDILPAGLSRALRRRAQEHDSTLFMVMYSALQLLLERSTGQSDFLVGTPMANRTRPELQQTIGFFANTVVLRSDLDGDPTVAELIARTRRTCLDAYAHQAVPFENLIAELHPERTPGHNPLFQTLFALEDSAYTTFSLGGVELTRIDGDSGTAKFDLSLFVVDGEDELALRAEYNTALFDRAGVERLVRHYRRALEFVAENPDRPVSDLSLLGEGESGAVVAGGRGVVASVGGVSVHGVFEGVAAAWPGRVAVRDGERVVTYGELDAWASGVAGMLAARGIGRGDVVGVCLPRSVELVAVLLGVWKAGAAYVPLDPVYPAARTVAVVGDAGLSVVVSRAGVMPAGVEAECPVVLLDEVDFSASVAAPGVAVDRSDLAYVLYTSGSTGVPKGVEIAQGSVLNLLAWARETFGAGELSAVAAVTSVCFDLSVFELFAPLTSGGSVVLVGNALELASVSVPVSLVNAVPSAVAELVAGGGFPAGVGTVCMAGEPFAAELVGRLRSLGVGRVLNLYGPSETTTYSTGAELGEGTQDPVPIGRPIHNTHVLVVDSAMRPVPFGVLGELCIGGAGVARGYRGRPSLTAERFLPDPFGDEPGARLYRTGDLVRQHATHLEFVGRVDHQVKVRGFRIELGEIETQLNAHPAVREAVVQVRSDGPTGDRLVGYAVPADTAPTGTTPTDTAPTSTTPTDTELARALREFLAQRLPAYMVPAGFVFLDRLPRTPNGKIDRGRLPSAERLTVVSGNRVGPRDETEEEVLRIWAGLLDLPAEQIGVHDNFFELGGDSLLAGRMAHILGERFRVRVPVREVFTEATPARFAALIAEGRQKQLGADEESRRIQSFLDEVDDTQLDRLLHAYASVTRESLDHSQEEEK
ncbi:non-ribosomal peptide synthetase [Streptomyces sp. 2-6]|uniref:non-ribosomal peptide synthetase n=1 Tax=Streptomyces sp. 2-6 TaxID=2978333 RepID=UPI003D0C8E6D